jgi:hypothetical protein
MTGFIGKKRTAGLLGHDDKLAASSILGDVIHPRQLWVASSFLSYDRRRPDLELQVVMLSGSLTTAGSNLGLTV